MYAITQTLRSPALAYLRDLNRLISSASSRGNATASVLSLQAVEYPEYYAVSLEVPGARKEELKVSIDDDLVTVTLTKASQTGTPETSGRVVYADRTNASATRIFRLPEDVAQADHEARLENGVLTLKFVKQPVKEKAIKELTIQ